MEIMSIWMAQRNLHRVNQIPAMIATLKDDGELPRIILNRDEDGSIQVQDGHHRLAAIWLSSRKTLRKHEYLLLEKDHWRPKCGKIVNLVSCVEKTGEKIGQAYRHRLESDWNT